MRSRLFVFNYANIQRIPDDFHGVYFVWTNSVCVYIGKADKMSLKNRLMSHYKRSHNDSLKLWIDSSHRLLFQYEVVNNPLAISAKERNRIKQLSPLTNVNLIKKGELYG